MPLPRRKGPRSRSAGGVMGRRRALETAALSSMRLHEGMHDANAELARVAALASGQKGGHVGLIDQNAQFRHVGRAQLRRRQGRPLNVFLPRREREPIDGLTVEENLDTLRFVEGSTGIIR